MGGKDGGRWWWERGGGGAMRMHLDTSMCVFNDWLYTTETAGNTKTADQTVETIETTGEYNCTRLPANEEIQCMNRKEN